MNHPIEIAAVESLLNYLRSMIVSVDPQIRRGNDLRRWFDASKMSPAFWGFAATLYQPKSDRLMVVRAAQPDPLENMRQAVHQLPRHPRFSEFAVSDWQRCRMQIDFILNEPQSVELAALSDSVLPEDRDGKADIGLVDAIAGPQPMAKPRPAEPDTDFAPWQVQVSHWAMPGKDLTRFELGVDGLRIVQENRRRYFLPGDAFVHSILGMAQLRRHIQRLFAGGDIEQLTYFRFRSLSFVSGVQPGTWLPLYRGLPPIPEVNDASLIQAARAGTKWIADSLQEDGRFVYYYDAATDTQLDHEHPTRDWKVDPYYNLLRHGGGVITLLLDEQLRQQDSRTRGLPCPSRDGPGDPSYDTDSSNRPPSRLIIQQSLDFFVDQLVDYESADGKNASYALYNRKAKLGGSGIGLCALAMYQRVFQDDRYASAACRLANHLLGEINDRGEFRYYHIYLDKPVAWEDNQRYFSFYYPGEAILGLSQYCQHVCTSDAERRIVFDKTHQSLRFLLRERPHLHQEHYQSLPSDSWLMMGINDLWDVAEFREDEYGKFVFDDADQMVRMMYTEADALYPDYVGSFYYQYGDHPYPDGARAEGLLAAYQLALKAGDEERTGRYREACNKVASATLRLCNTPSSVYSAANPERAIGGIRFKLTRQWFRVDTIQHVASFYLKLLMTETAK